MKKLSRIFLVILSALLITASVSACSSGAQSEVAESVDDPIDGLYVFSFLDQYYKNVRLIGEDLGEEVNTLVLDMGRNDPAYGEILNLLNDNERTYVDLPCGTGYVRKDSLILESLDVEFMDLTHTREENLLLATEALVVFHSLEGVPLLPVYSFVDSGNALMKTIHQEWEEGFKKSIKTFKENISVAAGDQSVIDSVASGEAVLLYSGKYNYSLYVKNLGDTSSSKEDHYVMSLKIEAN